MDLYVTRVPKLRCLATNLPSDSGFQLSWWKETPGVLNPDVLDLREEFNGTFTATSSLTISTQAWEAGERFTCAVNHHDLQVPLNRSISKASGEPSSPPNPTLPPPWSSLGATNHLLLLLLLLLGKVTPPLIFLFPPHAEEMTQSKVTLTCLVHGFQPSDLQVRWLKNHVDLPEETFVTTPPLKEGPREATFFLYSKLTFLKSSWLAGDTYTCMVVHQGLPMKFTQRQIQKVPGK